MRDPISVGSCSTVGCLPCFQHYDMKNLLELVGTFLDIVFLDVVPRKVPSMASSVLLSALSNV